ncbi:MAG: cytochrome c biogenesis protein [Aquificaceae bacterium]|nr:cytochrome c biogenesis protein [Aquificaceae bacterium]MCX8060276.1 cytochrome c biogenesis protein [Aquificaceae bacterium]MDW8097528.1 cytochrome c biogenesis protein CcsA [Aquificaceae bacterium]
MSLLYLSGALYFLGFFVSLLSHLWAGMRRMALLIVFLALAVYVLHVSMLAVRTAGFPFADTYGFYSLLGKGVLMAFLVLSLKQAYLQRFLALSAILGMLFTLLAMPAELSPYRSPLYSLHIVFALFSYAFVLAGGASSLLRLLIETGLKHKSLTDFSMPLSVLRTGERTFLSLSFLSFTLTLIFGSLWSRSFFGKHWIDDPKLLYVFFLWSYYAVLVHLNILKKVRPRTLSYSTVAGAVLSMVGLFLVRHEL